MDEQQQTAPEIISSYQSNVSKDLNVDYSLHRCKSDGNDSYSIKAILRETGEVAHIPDITADPAKAEYIFKLITRGGVTPCCLAEVIEDVIEAMPETALQPPELCPVGI